MDEQYIQRALGWHFGIDRGCIPIPNVLMAGGNYEADFIYINKNDYLTEVEIKISIQDFKADFKKKHYHDSKDVRSLYYALPKDLYKKDKELFKSMAGECGAGIIVVSGIRRCEIVQKATIRRQVKPLSPWQMLDYMRLGCLKWFKSQYMVDVPDINVGNKGDDE